MSKSEEHREYRYKMSEQEFQTRLEAQNNRCAGCKELFTPQNSACVDHDHLCCDNDSRKTCGKCIRGLVCNSCNMSLGQYETFPEYLEKYLEHWREVRRLKDLEGL